MADTAQKVNWALSQDGTGRCALGLGLLLLATLVVRGRKDWNHLLRLPSAWFAWVVALSAGLLSVAYVHVYLRGGPRIIDATTYLLEARLFAHGQFAFEPLGPISSYQGRFLVATSDLKLAPIFPPGYPALLACAVLLGQPMWLGPFTAGLLAVLVYRVGRAWFADEATARLAALLSVVSAAQRYHTADTMSHGFCALLVLAAVFCASKRGIKRWCSVGLCLGWLLATRPVSALACAVLCALVMCLMGERRPGERGLSLREVSAFTLGALPGVALLLVQQKDVTGAWLQSIQYLYYARSDFPSDCFRYGFGSGIGCQFEHGDFLSRYMPQGYNWRAALGTTGRRIAAHLCDAANLEVFAVLLPLIAWWGRARPPVVLLGAGLLLQCLAYVPFYFDGNYPAAGARFFADVLPFEHLLLAAFLVAYRVELLALAASLLGFALHSAHAHEQLRERDGARPMLEATSVPYAPANSKQVLFVDTDHGFNLGYDALPGWHVARYRGDASDYWLRESLGHVSSYRYKFSLGDDAPPTVLPFVPPPSDVTYGASFWPALSLVNATVSPIVPACFTAGPALGIRPSANAEARLQLELWAPDPGLYQLTLITSALSGGVGPDGSPRQVSVEGVTTTATEAEGGGCTRTTGRMLVHRAGRVPIWLATRQPTTLASIEFLAAVR